MSFIKHMIHCSCSYGNLFFFFFTLEANITRRCWRRWPLLSYQPMSYVSIAPSDVCRSEQNKSSCRNGSPPDFLCVCVERTPRVGAVRVDIRVLVHVFTCPVRWSRRCACACEGACVLECGLTFNSDTTGSICAPQGEVVIFSRENRQERKRTVPEVLEIIHILYLLHCTLV